MHRQRQQMPSTSDSLLSSELLDIFDLPQHYQELFGFAVP